MRLIRDVWEFLQSLFRRSKWFTILSAASTLALPFPFLGTHVRWTMTGVAAAALLVAVFHLHRDHLAEIERLEGQLPGDEPKLERVILDPCEAQFMIGAATDGSVLLYFDCIFSYVNKGPTTTVRLLGSRILGVKTRDGYLPSYMVANGTESGLDPKMELYSGDSGQLRCHFGARVNRDDWNDNTRDLVAKLMIQEAFTAPEIETYTFAASRA